MGLLPPLALIFLPHLQNVVGIILVVGDIEEKSSLACSLNSFWFSSLGRNAARVSCPQLLYLDSDESRKGKQDTTTVAVMR